MVDSKWLRRLQIYTNDITEAMDTQEEVLVSPSFASIGYSRLQERVDYPSLSLNEDSDVASGEWL